MVRVRASLALEDGPASVEFLFDATGDISEIFARARPARDGEGNPATLDWQGYVRNYAILSGRRIPLHAEIGYIYEDGCEAYWRGRITDYRPGGQRSFCVMNAMMSFARRRADLVWRNDRSAPIHPPAPA